MQAIGSGVVGNDFLIVCVSKNQKESADRRVPKAINLNEADTFEQQLNKTFTKSRMLSENTIKP